jgi:hypothetical protein
MADFLESPGDAAQVSLLVHIDGNTLSYTEENGRHRFEAEIVTMIFGSDGKRVDLKAETIRGTLAPDRLAMARQNGLRYVRRVALKPGLYQIRAGVREPANERTGTAATWVETADLSRGRLAMSSLVLSDAIPDLTAPSSAGNKEPLVHSRFIQGIRYYRAGQSLIYFFRLYNALKANPPTPGAGTDAETAMQIELLRDEKPVVTIPWQPASTRAIGQDAKGPTFGGQLVMPKMPPGIYELRISIKTAKEKRPIQRTVPFGIEP